MPAKVKGRPNEERRVKELLNKLKALKAAPKRPSDKVLFCISDDNGCVDIEKFERRYERGIGPHDRSVAGIGGARKNGRE